MTLELAAIVKIMGEEPGILAEVDERLAVNPAFEVDELSKMVSPLLGAVIATIDTEE